MVKSYFHLNFETDNLLFMAPTSSIQSKISSSPILHFFLYILYHYFMLRLHWKPITLQLLPTIKNWFSEKKRNGNRGGDGSS